MKKNNIKTTLAITLLVVSMISFASAFSVSKPYMPINQLNMTLGESKIIELVLQNGGATDPINVRVRVTEGSEIISLIGEDVYLVNPGDKVPVNFQLSIPETADWGSEYTIKIGFSESPANQEALSFGTEIEQSFNVKIQKTPQQVERDKRLKNILLIVGICVLILLVLIIIVVYVKKKKSR